jgi:hypothetical protein
VVNAYPGVTHNYRRAHDYNVWFTLIAPSEESLLQAISEISDRTEVRDILDLRATRIFKIDAHFPL